MKVIATLFLLGAVSVANAAGFDCSKAATKVEKLVCADAALSKLDGELAAEYQAARLRAAVLPALKAEQQAWLGERNRCPDAACLRTAYETRLGQLRERERGNYANLDGAVKATCTSLASAADADAADCKINESGRYGKLAESEQAYAVYCLDSPRPDATFCEIAAVALFAVDPRSQRVERWLQRIDANGDGNVYSKPQLVESRDGLLLDVPVSIPGTGDFNASMLFKRVGERWVEIDTTSWEKQLSARLPKGLGVWKGIWPDYKRMTALTGLYRSKDANCCATGGSADIALKIEGERLVLVSVKVLPPEPEP